MLVYISSLMTSFSTNQINHAKEIFRENGGILRTRDALERGIHPSILYKMRDEGILEVLSRGLYHLTSEGELGSPDLITISKRVPSGVICSLSALSYHNITTQIPHAVDVSLVRGSEPPRIQYPPIHIYWSVPHIFSQGIEEYQIDGHPVRIYSPERCVIDIFRYRNKLGLDSALEALRLYRERHKLKVDTLMQLAKVCRVKKVITPYLESTL